MSDERPTILIVDDDETILQLLTTALGRDYEILQASDGDEAVEIHTNRDEGVDLVLLDLGMGRMSGYDALAAMQMDDPDVRVIVITGLDPDAARLPNVRRIITKPFRVDQVRNAVAEELK
ncbi:MAG: response regulator [Gemmatimonadetes bacterium]|jgi:putative two-component system response regulator|nr:response regulator [Gemmatimonadota bacterium]MBT7862339.1 response regulator [Gemmatimonadota bacterium]